MSRADTRTPSSIGLGDPILCNGRETSARKVIAHPPGPHAGPIRADWWAVEVVTDNGSRWFGSETPPRILGDLRMHWNR